MKKEGYGGTGGSNLRGSNSVLRGVLAEDVDLTELPLQKCANPRCGKMFRPRADGDLYHSEACDLDSNPQFRGKHD